VIFRNAVVLPRASAVATPGFAQAVRSADPLALARITDTGRRLDADPLGRRPGGFGGPTVPADGDRYVLLSDEYASGWRLAGAASSPSERAFGWAIGFAAAGEADIDLRYGDQADRTLQVWLLAVVWVAALGFTSKPARRVAPRTAGRHVTAVEREEVPSE
jgi:hypothetical protein